MACSEATCNKLGIPRRVIDVRFMREILAGSGSALVTDAPVPEGHYEDESMKQTVVPNRNMILLLVAVARAIALKADAVAYGAHGTDRAIYLTAAPSSSMRCSTRCRCATGRRLACWCTAICRVSSTAIVDEESGLGRCRQHVRHRPMCLTDGTSGTVALLFTQPQNRPCGVA